MKNQTTLNYRRVRPVVVFGRRLMYLMGLAVAFSLATEIQAAIKVWTGTSGGNWSVSGNWSPSGAPVAGDILAFPDVGSHTRALTNDLSSRTFAVLGILDSGYTLRGNPLALSGGIVATQATGGVTIYCNLTLYGDQAFAAYRSAVLGINGAVSGTKSPIRPFSYPILTLNSVGSKSTITLNGTVGQINSLHKQDSGLAIIHGANSSFTGSTIVYDGTLRVENESSLGGAATSGTTVNSGGTLQVNCANFAEPLHLNGGALAVYSGFSDAVNYNGAITTDGGVLSSSAGPLYVYGAISGAGGVTKEGSGAVYLMSSNWYAGLTLVNNGTLYVGNAGALGSAAQGTTINSSAILSLGAYSGLPSSLDFTSESLRFSGTNSSLWYYGYMTWRGSVTVDPGCTGRIYARRPGDYPYLYSSLSLPGTINGTGNLEFWADEFVFDAVLQGNAANTLSGVTRIYGGQLHLQKPNGVYAIAGPLEIHGYDTMPSVGARVSIEAEDQLGGASQDSISMYNGGQLMLNGHSVDTQQLFMHGGSVWLGVNGQLTLWVNYPAIVGYDHGVIDYLSEGVVWAGVWGYGAIQVLTNASLTIGARIMNDPELFHKTGAGTLQLIGNINAAAARVDEGTLQVDGSQPLCDIVITNKAILQGNGAVESVTAWSGTLRPGSSPGRLTVGQSTLTTLTLTPNTTLEVELNGTVAGTNYDQLKVIGGVNLASASLKVSLGFVPAAGNSFVIVDNNGTDTIIGTFAGLPQGAQVVSSGIPFTFRISYVGGDGNDVVLTRLPVAGAAFTSWVMANHQIQLQAAGLAGLPYVLEATTNLCTANAWLPVGTNTANAGGFIAFTDSDVPLFSQRFYRIRSP